MEGGPSSLLNIGGQAQQQVLSAPLPGSSCSDAEHRPRQWVCTLCSLIKTGPISLLIWENGEAFLLPVQRFGGIEVHSLFAPIDKYGAPPFQELQFPQSTVPEKQSFLMFPLALTPLPSGSELQYLEWGKGVNRNRHNFIKSHSKQGDKKAFSLQTKPTVAQQER